MNMGFQAFVFTAFVLVGCSAFDVGWPTRNLDASARLKDSEYVQLPEPELRALHNELWTQGVPFQQRHGGNSVCVVNRTGTLFVVWKPQKPSVVQEPFHPKPDAFHGSKHHNQNMQPDAFHGSKHHNYNMQPDAFHGSKHHNQNMHPDVFHGSKHDNHNWQPDMFHHNLDGSYNRSRLCVINRQGTLFVVLKPQQHSNTGHKPYTSMNEVPYRSYQKQHYNSLEQLAHHSGPERFAPSKWNGGPQEQTPDWRKFVPPEWIHKFGPPGHIQYQRN